VTPDADGSRFPGSKPPSLSLYNLPSAIEPFVNVISAANKYASDVMRGKRVSGPPPQPEGNGASATPLERERTPAEMRLADLLKRQAELAADPTREEEYNQIVLEIAKASDAAEAMKEASHV
jgi:hypothetical protein